MGWNPADRAKQIHTRASVNENVSDKRIDFLAPQEIQPVAETIAVSPSAPIDPNPELLNYQFNGHPPGDFRFELF